MKTVFADSNYLIALLHPGDELHEIAVSVSAGLGEFRLMTTEMVLAEVLNDLGRRGASLRRLAAETVTGLIEDENALVVPQSTELFHEALTFYRGHQDKRWGLTDCASFLTMWDQGVSEALTYDHHFEQAGFSALLRK